MEPINLTKDYTLEPFDLQKSVEKVDITLRDLFEIVYVAEIQHEGIADCLGMPNFMEFYEEITKSPSEKRSELHYLELYWHKEYNLKEINKKLVEIIEEAELFPQMEFHAIGEHWKDNSLNCLPNCKNHNSYAIEFTSLNDMAHLPIKLNPIIKYEKMKIITYPSLYQVINSIFYELTFTSYDPITRDTKREELFNRVNEAKEESLIQQGDEIIREAIEEDNKKN